MKKIALVVLIVLIISGCTKMNKAQTGATGGAAGGALIGQAIGHNTEATLIGGRSAPCLDI